MRVDFQDSKGFVGFLALDFQSRRQKFQFQKSEGFPIAKTEVSIPAERGISNREEREIRSLLGF